MLSIDRAAQRRSEDIEPKPSLRDAAELLQEGQASVLEMIATGAPLPEVLAAVCRTIEEQDRGLLCSVLLPDERGRHIGLAAGARLLDSCLRGLEGLRIDPPYIGSRSEALDRGEVLVVPDVAADEKVLPAMARPPPEPPLRACRSIPVFGGDRRCWPLSPATGVRQGTPNHRTVSLRRWHHI